MGQYRQWDVLLTRISALPGGTQEVRETGRIILAHGEVTGHAHDVDASVARLFTKSGVEDRYLVIAELTELTHPEHAAIPLPPGVYEVRRQREYDDEEEVRRVAD